MVKMRRGLLPDSKDEAMKEDSGSGGTRQQPSSRHSPPSKPFTARVKDELQSLEGGLLDGSSSEDDEDDDDDDDAAEAEATAVARAAVRAALEEEDEDDVHPDTAPAQLMPGRAYCAHCWRAAYGLLMRPCAVAGEQLWTEPIEEGTWRYVEDFSHSPRP